MPSKPRDGMRALYVELPADLDERLRTFCDQVGKKVADQVRVAIRRHLDYPPPQLDVPPLPDVASGNAAQKKHRRRTRRNGTSS